MKMLDIGIANFTSFDNLGILLSDIGKINIIVGKNNSGKSNILKFLKLLSDNINNLSTFPGGIIYQHRDTVNHPEITLRFHTKELDNKAIQMYYQQETMTIRFDIIDSTIIGDNPLKDIPADQLGIIFNENPDLSQDQILTTSEGKLIDSIRNSVLSSLLDLIYIPPMRELKSSSTSPEDKTIAGAKIIDKIYESQIPVVGQETDLNQRIQEFISVLVNDKDITIEIPTGRKDIVIRMNGLRRPLDSFGTGIQEILLITSAIVMNPHSIVLIEEPEIHLHPELQRMFLNVINTTDNTYFIATHSNVFLDSSVEASVYHITYDGVKSAVNQIKKQDEKFNIIYDLGYKASDIIQSNCIIWVEGPSDRIYINHWMGIIAPKLEEGHHYSIMFYGGNLISHLSVDNDVANFINLSKLNQQSAIIIDSDKKKEDDSINKSKTRVKNEFESKDRFVWVTQGREIENYLPYEDLTEILKEKYGEDIEIYDYGQFTKITKYKKDDDEKSINKVDIARKMIEKINDLTVLDLNDRINDLITFIRKANQMETEDEDA